MHAFQFSCSHFQLFSMFISVISSWNLPLFFVFWNVFDAINTAAFSRHWSVLISVSVPPLPPLPVHLSLRPAGLIISLQLLRGDMEQVRRENPLIFSRGVAITRKLGFPDVIMPGESATCAQSRHDEVFSSFFMTWIRQQNQLYYYRKC